jgi:hypothetical protein
VCALSVSECKRVRVSGWERVNVCVGLGLGVKFYPTNQNDDDHDERRRPRRTMVSGQREKKNRL